jgi:prepilin-type N-terminal cleavage/methylation domain-containing protein
MKNTPSNAFTLIELLIVITIIAVLASIALPAFTGVKERADQTKDLSNAKQIALALRQFAIDNNGSYPAKQPAAEYSEAPATLPTNSNDALWWLFPNYLQSEGIFAVSGSAYTPANPDNRMDAAGAATRTDTLKIGENTYAYVAGLSDTSNPIFPLIADGFAVGSPGTYATNKAVKGGVWSGKKAIVVFCDSSGQVMPVNSTTHQIQRTSSTGARVNMFDGAEGWLEPQANPVLNPQ